MLKLKDDFQISRDRFIQLPLEDSLVLSNREDRLLILSPEGKVIVQEYFSGKGPEEIARVLQPRMDLPLPEILQFVESFLASLADHARGNDDEQESVSAEPLPDDAPYETREYELLGKKCLVRYGDASAVMILHPLIAHLETSNSNVNIEGAEIVFDLLPQGEMYAFYCNGKECAREKSLVYVKNVALFEIFAALYPDKSWLTVFHSAVVEKDGCAVILSGFSGKGKSTLTAYLTTAGFNLVSDDLGILESENAGVMATPYAVSLKEDTWGVLSDYIPEIASLEPRKVYEEALKFYTPPLFEMRKSPPEPVGKACLVFINYKEGASRKLTPLTAAEALAKVVGIGAWISHEESHLKRFIAWIAATPAYELTYPDFSSAEKAILNITAEK